ncbi:MAG: DUF551 domain-containing protein [Lachnospiraceae bacterium]
MNRLTIPDKKIPGGVSRAIVDTRAVREEAMTLYWALKKYEDTGLTPEEVEQIKESRRWIPVEERLPEDDDSVILCTIHGSVKEGTYTERYGYAMRKVFFTENCFEELCDTTAWMPLPEPYRPEN